MWEPSKCGADGISNTYEYKRKYFIWKQHVVTLAALLLLTLSSAIKFTQLLNCTVIQKGNQEKHKEWAELSLFVCVLCAAKTHVYFVQFERLFRLLCRVFRPIDTFDILNGNVIGSLDAAHVRSTILSKHEFLSIFLMGSITYVLSS